MKKFLLYNHYKSIEVKKVKMGMRGGLGFDGYEKIKKTRDVREVRSKPPVVKDGSLDDAQIFMANKCDYIRN